MMEPVHMAKKKPIAVSKKKSPARPEKAEVSADRVLVRDLAEILRETELTEIEVERNGLRVRVV